MSKQKPQADSSIHEDQLRNFLVNALTGAFGISIAGNGDKDETDGLYYSEAKRGTTAFHADATLYARVKNKRYTLAVRRLTDVRKSSGDICTGSTWRRRAEAGIASGGGPLKSSFEWLLVQRGTHLR